MDELRKDQMEERTGETGENIRGMEFPVAQPEQTVKKPSVNIPLLAKWIGVLFWLIIAANIASLFTSENVTNAVPSLAFAGQILNIVTTAAYGVILLKIASESIYYRNSAICCFITAVVAVAMIPVSDDTDLALAIPVVIVSVIVSMIGEYYEYKGHTDVLNDVSPALSEKWIRLWKWYMGTFLGIIGGTVLAVMIPLIGMIIVLGATIGTMVVSVVKIVYIYKTAKAFRNYPI